MLDGGSWLKNRTPKSCIVKWHGGGRRGDQYCIMFDCTVHGNGRHRASLLRPPLGLSASVVGRVSSTKVHNKSWDVQTKDDEPR